MSRFPRRRFVAQGYVEFGVAIAVVALISMAGLDQIRGAVYTYFTGEGMTHTLNPSPPTSPPPPPSYTTDVNISCPAMSPPVALGQFYDCTATVIFTPPFNTGVGYDQLTLDVSSARPGGHALLYGWGAPGFNITCTLSHVTNDCAFKYIADFSGAPISCPAGCGPPAPYALNTHTIRATYNPPPPPTSPAWITGIVEPFTFAVKRQAKTDMHDPTNGKVTCTELYVRVGDSIKCWTTVVDIDTTPRPAQFPQGSVSFRECDPVPLGPCTNTNPPLSSATCSLVSYGGGSPDIGICSATITYTPLASELALYGGVRAFRVQYSGDGLHTELGQVGGLQDVTVVNAYATNTTLASCSPASISVASFSKCHVEVHNSMTSTNPSGSVDFNKVGGTGNGDFGDALGPGPTSCALSPIASPPASSACDIYFWPTSTGDPVIGASYAAQGGFGASNSTGSGSDKLLHVF